MSMLNLYKYICVAYSKQSPHPLPGSLLPLGKTCIPERYDEAFGPSLPVLAPGGGSCGVLRAVTAAPAFRLALPGASHTSRPPEAGPWAHPCHTCLHPLCSLLSLQAPSRSRPVSRNVEKKSQKDSASQAFCVAVPSPSHKMWARLQRTTHH